MFFPDKDETQQSSYFKSLCSQFSFRCSLCSVLLLTPVITVILLSQVVLQAGESSCSSLLGRFSVSDVSGSNLLH